MVTPEHRSEGSTAARCATGTIQEAVSNAPHSSELPPEEEVKEEFSNDSYDDDEVGGSDHPDSAANGAAVAGPPASVAKLDQNRLLRQLMESDGSFSDGQPSPTHAGGARRRPISGQETSSFLFGDDKARYEFLKKLQSGQAPPSSMAPKE